MSSNLSLEARALLYRVRYHPSAQLFNSKEDKNLSPKQVLINWVNFHLTKSLNRKIENFGSDLHDSICLSYLLKETLQGNANFLEVLQLKEIKERANKLIELISQTTYSRFICTPDDIVNGNEDEIIKFICNIFLWSSNSQLSSKDKELPNNIQDLIQKAKSRKKQNPKNEDSKNQISTVIDRFKEQKNQPKNTKQLKNENQSKNTKENSVPKRKSKKKPNLKIETETQKTGYISQLLEKMNMKFPRTNPVSPKSANLEIHKFRNAFMFPKTQKITKKKPVSNQIQQVYEKIKNEEKIIVDLEKKTEELESQIEKEKKEKKNKKKKKVKNQTFYKQNLLETPKFAVLDNIQMLVSFEKDHNQLFEEMQKFIQNGNETIKKFSNMLQFSEKYSDLQNVDLHFGFINSEKDENFRPSKLSLQLIHTIQYILLHYEMSLISKNDVTDFYQEIELQINNIPNFNFEDLWKKIFIVIIEENELKSENDENILRAIHIAFVIYNFLVIFFSELSSQILANQNVMKLLSSKLDSLKLHKLIFKKFLNLVHQDFMVSQIIDFINDFMKNLFIPNLEETVKSIFENAKKYALEKMMENPINTITETLDNKKEIKQQIISSNFFEKIINCQKSEEFSMNNFDKISNSFDNTEYFESPIFIYSLFLDNIKNTKRNKQKKISLKFFSEIQTMFRGFENDFLSESGSFRAKDFLEKICLKRKEIEFLKNSVEEFNNKYLPIEKKVELVYQAYSNIEQNEENQLEFSEIQKIIAKKRIKKQGYLYFGKGENNQNFQKRFVQIQGDYLFIFEKEPSLLPTKTEPIDFVYLKKIIQIDFQSRYSDKISIFSIILQKSIDEVDLYHFICEKNEFEDWVRQLEND